MPTTIAINVDTDIQNAIQKNASFAQFKIKGSYFK